MGFNPVKHKGGFVRSVVRTGTRRSVGKRDSSGNTRRATLKHPVSGEIIKVDLPAANFNNHLKNFLNNLKQQSGVPGATTVFSTPKQRTVQMQLLKSKHNVSKILARKKQQRIIRSLLSRQQKQKISFVQSKPTRRSFITSGSKRTFVSGAVSTITPVLTGTSKITLKGNPIVQRIPLPVRNRLLKKLGKKGTVDSDEALIIASAAVPFIPASAAVGLGLTGLGFSVRKTALNPTPYNYGQTAALGALNLPIIAFAARNPLKAKLQAEINKLPAKKANLMKNYLKLSKQITPNKITNPPIQNIEGAKVYPKSVPVIRSFLQKENTILTGSVINHAQLPKFKAVKLRQPQDIDIYVSNPKASQSFLLTKLKKKGIDARPGVQDSIDFFKGSKRIHTIGLKTFTSFRLKLQETIGHKAFLPLDFFTVRSKNGIRMLNIQIQAKRKLIGGFIQRKRPSDIKKDLDDFKALYNTAVRKVSIKNVLKGKRASYYRKPRRPLSRSIAYPYYNPKPNSYPIIPSPYNPAYNPSKTTSSTYHNPFFRTPSSNFTNYPPPNYLNRPSNYIGTTSSVPSTYTTTTFSKSGKQQKTTKKQFLPSSSPKNSYTPIFNNGHRSYLYYPTRSQAVTDGSHITDKTSFNRFHVRESPLRPNTFSSRKGILKKFTKKNYRYFEKKEHQSDLIGEVLKRRF